MSTDTDYYAILGLTRVATSDEIRAAYAELSEALRARGDDSTLVQIDAAYKILGDGHKRMRYDLERMERDLDRSERVLQWSLPTALRVDGVTSGMTFEEELAATLGDLSVADAQPMSAATVRQADAEACPVPGSDCRIAVEIGLEQAIRGGTVTVAYAIPCHDGAGTQRSAEIRIPKLTRHGQQLLEKGRGGPGSAGGAPGDLHVEVRYRRHPLFHISGDDIWYHFPIAPWEAVLGAILELPTMEGVPVRAHTPAGTTSGHTFRLPGRGLPKAGGGRGDLLACLRIVTPQSLTEAERQLYVRLAQLSSFDPRRGMQ